MYFKIHNKAPKFTEPLGSELVVGEQPNLEGKPFETFIAQAYWCESELQEEANVIWINQQGLWHHLCFDEDIVFWRIMDEGPKYTPPKEEDIWDFPLEDLNKKHELEGQVLESIEHKITEANASVEFKFSNGLSLKIVSQNDSTKIET